jgi:hypothetical protein
VLAAHSALQPIYCQACYAYAPLVLIMARLYVCVVNRDVSRPEIGQQRVIGLDADDEAPGQRNCSVESSVSATATGVR